MKTTDIIELLEQYRSLGIYNTVDFEKVNNVLITHHSTAIEGSTLTEVETELIVNGLTPRGKPLSHPLMVRDHYDALVFALESAKQKTPVSIALIQKIAGKVLKGTGAVYETVLGTVDATRGEFRKGNVRVGSSHFPSHDRVAPLIDGFVKNLQGSPPEFFPHDTRRNSCQNKL